MPEHGGSPRSPPRHSKSLPARLAAQLEVQRPRSWLSGGVARQALALACVGTAALIIASVLADAAWELHGWRGSRRLGRAAAHAPAAAPMLQPGMSPAGTPPSPAAASPARRPRAMLRSPLVDANSSDTCAEGLGIRKVALLFLSLGPMPHETAWRLWFQSAAALPADALARACAAGNATAHEPAAGLPPACGGSGNESDAIERQHLFSVYVHAPPSFGGYPPDSLWAGRLVRNRVHTAWGTHRLVLAARHLLWAAFRDPLNERFVLLSESDVPLYDPLTLHAQLLAEARSRVNACPHRATMPWRWLPAMAAPGLNETHWRKSSQWFGLTRSHAEVVLRDEQVFRSFEAHCSGRWVPAKKAYIDCFPDEHYLPTLLAARGLERECECASWGVAAVDWSAGGAHPRSWAAAEVSPALVWRLRGDPAACNASAAQASAAERYIPQAELVGVRRGGPAACARLAATTARRSGAPPAYVPLAPTCPLTARKFNASTVDAVLQLVSNCSSDTRLLSHCSEAGSPGARARR